MPKSMKAPGAPKFVPQRWKAYWKEVVLYYLDKGLARKAAVVQSKYIIRAMIAADQKKRRSGEA